jgi:flagellar protein FliO/FliZ
MTTRNASGCCVGLVAVPVSLAAQSVETGASTSSLGIFLQVFFGLVLVLGVFVLVAVLMRRFMPLRQGAGGMVRIVGGIMVGPRERVVLVEIEDTWLVLGVASGQVRTLHTMPRGQAATDTRTQAGPSFADWLSRTVRRQAKD